MLESEAWREREPEDPIRVCRCQHKHRQIIVQGTGAGTYVVSHVGDAGRH